MIGKVLLKQLILQFAGAVAVKKNQCFAIEPSSFCVRFLFNMVIVLKNLRMTLCLVHINAFVYKFSARSWFDV